MKRIKRTVCISSNMVFQIWVFAVDSWNTCMAYVTGLHPTDTEISASRSSQQKRKKYLIHF